MARDISIKSIENNKGYDLRCKCFKRIEGTQTYEPKFSCVFYAKEISPLQATSNIVNGIVKGTRYAVTIETLDYVDDLVNDDKVLFKGQLYRIDSISSLSISNQENSIRATKQTTINLVR